jgi:hypothetical protein
VITLSPEEKVRLAVMLRDYNRQRRRNGLLPLNGLATLADEMLGGQDNRHSPPDRAGRARKAAAERTARWRARQRGEDVPLRKSERPRRTENRHELAS